MSSRAQDESLVAMLSVTLDRNAAEPLVRQLYRTLRELILTRRLAAGARLPSTRKLSRELNVSRPVTLDAFAQLGAEGFIDSRRGSGHFVAELRVPAGDTTPRAEAAEGASEISVWSAAGRPFDPAWQAVDLFPSQVWSRMLGRGWRRHQRSALERHWAGLPVLRAALAQHLHALRGVPLGPEQIMITSGNADALTLIARSLGRAGGEQASAWIEDPGYGAPAQILERERVAPVSVRVDADGLDVSDGERLAPGAAFALVTATRQFPLGMPLSLGRRLALLDWARRSGGLIVDDDYDGEIRFAGRPLQSLAGLDPSARVLTLGSFSKLTFPGLRLGYVAGPADLIARLAEVRRVPQSLIPSSEQAAFAEFITTGGLARHLRQLRTYLTQRRLILVEKLRAEAAELVEIMPQEVGMQLTIRLAPHLAERASDIALAERAAEQGLVLMPLSPQYREAVPEEGFLLGYAGWSEAQLRAGVRELVKLLRS